MARPRFTPDAGQRRTLDALIKAAKERERKQAAIDQPLDRVIARAVEEEIPVAAIAETLGWQRKTVYRHLGRDM